MLSCRAKRRLIVQHPQSTLKWRGYMKSPTLSFMSMKSYHLSPKSLRRRDVSNEISVEQWPGVTRRRRANHRRYVESWAWHHLLHAIKLVSRADISRMKFMQLSRPSIDCEHTGYGIPARRWILILHDRSIIDYRASCDAIFDDGDVMQALQSYHKTAWRISDAIIIHQYQQNEDGRWPHAVDFTIANARRKSTWREILTELWQACRRAPRCAVCITFAMTEVSYWRRLRHFIPMKYNGIERWAARRGQEGEVIIIFQCMQKRISAALSDNEV